jgi:hypothetical protein
LQIKKIVSCHTADSKPVKQEVNGTVILPPLVFPGRTNGSVHVYSSILNKLIKSNYEKVNRIIFKTQKVVSMMVFIVLTFLQNLKIYFCSLMSVDSRGIRNYNEGKSDASFSFQVAA